MFVQRLAVKCYDLGHGKDRRQKRAFLLAELETYCKLHHLQGHVIPRLHWVAVDGPLVFLGLDLCTVMPAEEGAWTTADIADRDRQLAVLRSNGVVQNDVRCVNFGRRGGRMMCFDLEDCSFLE